MESVQNYSIRCPKCETDYTIQISGLKAIDLLTSQKKLICTICGKSFFVSGTTNRSKVMIR